MPSLNDIRSTFLNYFEKQGHAVVPSSPLVPRNDPTLMFVMAGVIRFVIGPNDQQFADGVRFVISARDFREMTGLREGLAIKTTQVITLAAAAIWSLALGR